MQLRQTLFQAFCNMQPYLMHAVACSKSWGLTGSRRLENIRHKCIEAQMISALVAEKS